jgi:hypothetical protein
MRSEYTAVSRELVIRIRDRAIVSGEQMTAIHGHTVAFQARCRLGTMP